MSKHYYHVQCRMERKSPTGTDITRSWIPQKFAVVGKTVKLKDNKGVWSDGWIVVGTFAKKLTIEVRERELDHLRHRQHSDI